MSYTLFLLLLTLVHSTFSSLAPMDQAALESIRDSLTDMPGSAFFSIWDFTIADPCSSFSGLTCSSLGRVTALSLGPNLSGSISPSISNLTHLSLLMLGTINALEKLTELLYIDLSMNQFTGPIPNSLFSTTISTMFLQRNNFTSIATSIEPSLLPQGSIIDLSHNSISGELPPALAGAEVLFVNNNRLTGDIPEEYVKSLINDTTKQLFLQHNYFTRFPWNSGLQLPDSVSLCLSYNCMETDPVVGLSTCLIEVAPMLSRPASQCSRFYNHSSTG